MIKFSSVCLTTIHCLPLCLTYYLLSIRQSALRRYWQKYELPLTGASGAYSGSLCFSVKGCSPLSVAVIKHSDWKELREGVVSACTSRSVVAEECELSARSRSRSPAQASLALPYSIGPPLEEGCHPWWSGPFYINRQSRQFLTDMATGQSDLDNSSIEISFPLLSLDCIKWKKKTNQHTQILIFHQCVWKMFRFMFFVFYKNFMKSFLCSCMIFEAIWICVLRTWSCLLGFRIYYLLIPLDESYIWYWHPMLPDGH